MLVMCVVYMGWNFAQWEGVGDLSSVKQSKNQVIASLVLKDFSASGPDYLRGAMKSTFFNLL